MSLLTELVNVYADRAASESLREAYLRLFPAQQAELEPLLVLTDNLRSALRPVKPRPEFRECLRQGLLIAAREQTSNLPAALTRMVPRDLFWGAVAVGSALSIIGITAHLLRQRATSSQTLA